MLSHSSKVIIAMESSVQMGSWGGVRPAKITPGMIREDLEFLPKADQWRHIGCPESEARIVCGPELRTTDSRKRWCEFLNHDTRTQERNSPLSYPVTPEAQGEPGQPSSPASFT